MKLQDKKFKKLKKDFKCSSIGELKLTCTKEEYIAAATDIGFTRQEIIK